MPEKNEKKTARDHGVSPVEDRPILSATKSTPKSLVFSDISLTATFTESTENECIIISGVICRGSQ